MKRFKIICFMALFAVVLTLNVNAQRRSYGNELFDVFMLNWIEGDKAINEQAMLNAFNTLNTERNKYRGDEQAFFDKFLLSWTNGRSVDTNALIKAFNTLSATRSKITAASDRTFFDSFVLAWIESGVSTTGSAGAGNNRRGRGTDEQEIISSYDTMTRSRARYRGNEDFFDPFVIAWVGSSKTVDNTEILRAFNLLTQRRGQLNANDKAFFDQVILFWIASERKVDTTVIINTYNNLAKERGSRTGRR